MTDESGFQMKFDETLFYYEFCCQCVGLTQKEGQSTGQKKSFILQKKFKLFKKVTKSNIRLFTQIISTLRFNFDRYSLKH